METLLKRSLTVWRRVAGEDTTLERAGRRYYGLARSVLEKTQVGPNFTLFWAGANRNHQVGIYLQGGCHLLSLFSSVPLIRPVLNGRCCILKEGLVADSRSDILLQTLDAIPQAHAAQTLERLQLPSDYFFPRLFERTFTIPGLRGPEEFPKTVVVLSIAADVVRTVYRHREHGFLVDPGGWWFGQPMTAVLADLATANWFREHFVSVGKIPVEVFMQNFARIVELVKRNTGAHVLVLNVLSVEPGSLIHNYQFVRNPQPLRLREFNLALAELSQKLDFSILDLDRVLRRAGVSAQLDFGHFPVERYQPIAQEAFRILKELGVF